MSTVLKFQCVKNSFIEVLKSTWFEMNRQQHGNTGASTKNIKQYAPVVTAATAAAINIV